MTDLGGLHDEPTAAGLVEAVREFLEVDVMAATDGRVRFHARVAVNVLRMVERELAAAGADGAEHASGLAALGYASEADLAAAIRSGAADHHADEVAAFVRATVRSKLAVANPAWLADPP